jgi:hypothetical protein
VEEISLMPNLTRGLVAHGFSDTDIGKILGGNLLRLFARVRAAADPTPRTPERSAIGALTGGATPP